jgi:hypothetical protein
VQHTVRVITCSTCSKTAITSGLYAASIRCLYEARNQKLYGGRIEAVLATTTQHN